jgi:hypothetical protein
MKRYRAKFWAPALSVLTAVLALASPAAAEEDPANSAPGFMVTLHGGVGNELSAGALAEFRLIGGLYIGSGFYLAHNFSADNGSYGYYSIPILAGYRFSIAEIFEIRPLVGARILLDPTVSEGSTHVITDYETVAFTGALRASFILKKHFVVGLQADVTPSGITWDQKCESIQCADPTAHTEGRPVDASLFLVHVSAVAGVAF